VVTVKSFGDAVEEALLQDNFPVVTDYGIFRIGLKLAGDRKWQGEPIKYAPTGWDIKRSRSLTKRLTQRRAIVADQDFRSGVWRVVQATRAGTAEEVACIADPFCYVSHLSAMQRYGLTDRSPEALHITRPSRQIWNAMRLEKLSRDLPPEHVQEASGVLLHFGINPTLRRRPMTVHETKYPAKTTEVRGENTRIAEIGQVFVDMLAQPHLCGGIHHALEVWDSQAKAWLSHIVEAVESESASIVKVRAGYILSERLGISDPRIEAWKVFAQRGGSRKLDPDAPYAPTFSEAWMISLNA
jgi:predicted transcriptional regulator of viral defense system